ncbi:ABC transporter substrate-binding protein [Acidovorax sp. Leaf78]|uniref:ABC transporter substrate-binding protein n=1 Tax=unclassified Acidovorax TaxID=2684926 RepID=UPI0006F353A9|nr:ABC transporter substrate-binding protein [Acidovorax sp. Leaf78]KQO14863.1 peptide ABC transporter [Acidovorax sp. Leaf78]
MQTSGTNVVRLANSRPANVARRGLVGLAALLALWGAGPGAASAQQAGAPAKGGAANLAMVGEPQGLDPMVSTADLVGTIMQHVYEPLYTFDGNWNIAPMLAEGMPTVSKDGLNYTIALRKGVKFHNGREMTAEDVVASLQRWMELSPRGKAVGKEVVALTAKGTHGVELKLKNPYAPLLAQLALPSGMAAILAKESIAPQLKEFIGTGPYKFKERRPDQFTVLVRFDDYAARKEAPSGYAGRREALLDELRFVPVPSANTRVEGALSGQFHYADLLPVEAIGRVEKGAPAVVPIVTKNFGFPYIVFNTKEGVLASQPLRRAVQTAVGTGELMAAGFGDNRFFMVEPNFFPKGTPYYSDAGAKLYNERNPQAAKEQAAKAGYNNSQPVRIMASRQYEFHYNMALVMSEQLKKAGFKTDLQVVDWATLVQRRNDAKLWDVYFTHSGLFPEPMLSPPQLGDGAPGWWESDAKKSTLAAFNQETDPAKRGALWGKVQQVVYDEVPFIEVGKFNGLSARSAKLSGYTPAVWPFFWNTWMK